MKIILSSISKKYTISSNFLKRIPDAMKKSYKNLLAVSNFEVTSKHKGFINGLLFESQCSITHQ
jgi:hypothetical protein